MMKWWLDPLKLFQEVWYFFYCRVHEMGQNWPERTYDHRGVQEPFWEKIRDGTIDDFIRYCHSVQFLWPRLKEETSHEYPRSNWRRNKETIPRLAQDPTSGGWRNKGWDRLCATWHSLPLLIAFGNYHMKSIYIKSKVYVKYLRGELIIII